MTLNTGIAFGRSMGIEAISLNVHYTDGVYEDPTTETFKIATDGIKIYFTPDLREYTSMRKQLINVPYGPRELVIPPSTERFFVTRTCIVDTSCQDATNNQVQGVAQYLGFSGRRRLDEEETDGLEESDDYLDTYFGDDVLDSDNDIDLNISCETLKSYCFVDQFGIYLQRLCPVSCGLCGDMPDDTDGTTTTTTTTTTKVNPRDPFNYRVSSISYHAHLLGNEMYATLLREEKKDTQDQEDVEISVAKKQADISSTPSMTAKDLKSREIWFYDNQETVPMDKEFAIDVDEGGDSYNSYATMVGGVEVKAGDKIQVSCVYNSMNRNKATYFGLSTYDEMCIIGVFVTFKTPSLDEIGDVDFGTELNLRSFNCALDDENHTTDVWQGTLESDEDARSIWYDHPIEATDTCTYPVTGNLLDNTVTGEARDCPEKEDDHKNKNNLICYGLDVDDELLSSPIAGYLCVGGTYDQKDSNEAPLYITKDKCIVEGGGTEYNSYTCSDAEFFLASEASVIGVTDEIREFLRTNWWQPKCCGRNTGNEKENDTEQPNEDAVATQTAGALGVDDEDSSSSGADVGVFGNRVASTLSMVFAIIASII
jgi:hypothetical protein